VKIKFAKDRRIHGDGEKNQTAAFGFLRKHRSESVRGHALAGPLGADVGVSKSRSVSTTGPVAGEAKRTPGAIDEVYH
jgi:hypothetical protein